MCHPYALSMSLLQLIQHAETQMWHSMFHSWYYTKALSRNIAEFNSFPETQAVQSHKVVTQHPSQYVIPVPSPPDILSPQVFQIQALAGQIPYTEVPSRPQVSDLSRHKRPSRTSQSPDELTAVFPFVSYPCWPLPLPLLRVLLISGFDSGFVRIRFVVDLFITAKFRLVK
jgi:hypothetical protein